MASLFKRMFDAFKTQEVIDEPKCRGGYNCQLKVEHDGYCLNHKHMSKLPEARKQRKPIPAMSSQKRRELREQQPQRDLQTDWFEKIEADECKGGMCQCWNCGHPIPQAKMKFATAHILPKRGNQFPSVKTHPLNYLILGADCGCHDEYDCTWEDASKMRIWPLAVSRFLQVYPDIAPTELSKLPDQLRAALNTPITVPQDLLQLQNS